MDPDSRLVWVVEPVFPLMEHIAAQGFTALAYDHPAHGESEGAFGHVPHLCVAWKRFLTVNLSLSD